MNISKETKTQEKDSNIIINDDGSVIARFKNIMEISSRWD